MCPSPPPPDEEPRATYHHGDLRRAVLDAAVVILAELGVEGFTLREAARRVGVTHRAVYRHFEDKRSVLASVAEEGYRELEAEMRGAIERSGACEPEDRLVVLCEGYVRFARRERARYQIMFGPRLNADERFPALEAAVRGTLRVVSHELKLAGPDAPPLARRDAGITLWSTVHGFASLHLAGRVPLSDRHVARYVDTVVRPVVVGVVDALRPR
ncbi:MAG TPA: WHG domain-containing protein [Polyangiaceae bacterium]|nr:WHG domain-containing protein [Polyangiaceae bacterium]